MESFAIFLKMSDNIEKRIWMSLVLLLETLTLCNSFFFFPLIVMLFLREFQLMTFVLDDNSLSSQKSILYQIISCHPYQNLINERHVCKNKYSLIHVFQLLVDWLFFVDMSHIY